MTEPVIVLDHLSKSFGAVNAVQDLSFIYNRDGNDLWYPAARNENMLKLSRMGVSILPPVHAFHNHPQNLDDMINHVTMRILDQFAIHLDVMNRGDGTMLTSADVGESKVR